MNELHAPGLTADWLNGWLAAIGVTVLVRGARLCWTDDPLPVAVFESDGDLVDQLAERLPTEEELQRLVIAKCHPRASKKLERIIKIEAYCERARLARELGDWTLALVATDLGAVKEGRLPSSPFDPSASGGVTLHDFVLGCRRSRIDWGEKGVRKAFAGYPDRAKVNGLGFDYRRILSGSDPISGKWSAPLIELLVFSALQLFPVRGDGRRSTVRGWTDDPSQRGAFRWPAWKPSLSAPAIDALLDNYWRQSSGTRDITAEYQVVPYRQASALDQTHGFASERITPA